ncbi:acriflavin resistance protein B [Salmonella enterica subsp. enterica]|nr:acriflavin resistance protein B [Salmonella enterica subsp. enterica]
MPNFFIDRPIFAWVIAIIIMLAGGLAVINLLSPGLNLNRSR